MIVGKVCRVNEEGAKAVALGGADRAREGVALRGSALRVHVPTVDEEVKSAQLTSWRGLLMHQPCARGERIRASTKRRSMVPGNERARKHGKTGSFRMKVADQHTRQGPCGPIAQPLAALLNWRRYGSGGHKGVIAVTPFFCRYYFKNRSHLPPSCALRASPHGRPVAQVL